MPDDPTTIWLAVTRFIHLASCLLLFAVWMFDRLIAAPAIRWRESAKRLAALAIPLVLLSGVAWLAIVAAQMNALFPERPFAQVLWTVSTQMHFGSLWQFRLICWALAAASTIAAIRLPPAKRTHDLRAWAALAFAALLLASLAWAGHGQDGRPAQLHLLADTLHLLAAGCWPAGLLPLAVTLWNLRRDTSPDQWQTIAAVIHRFSAMALAAATLLTATGLVNTWFLLGPASNLLLTPYGRMLLAKIICTTAAIAIGAANLLRLRPRLRNADDTHPRTARQLQFNIAAELAITAAILALVALLGVLPPGGHHHG